MFQSAITNQLLRGLDPMHSKTINLRVGQVFQGKITNLYPGQLAQLQLGGLTLTAKLEAQLEKGRSYWFQVSGGDSLPRLKVLENLPSVEASQQERAANSSSEARNIPTLLQQFNLTNTTINRHIMQRFIQENIPFTRENISQGSAVVEQSPLPRNESIQLLMHMLKVNIPIIKESFNSMASLYSNQTMNQSINNLLTLFQSNQQGQVQFNELLSSLRNLQNVQASHKTSEVPAQINQQTTNLANLPASQLENIPTQVRDVRIPMLNQIAQLFGFQHEFNIGGQVQQSEGISQFQNLKAQLLMFLQETRMSSEFSQAREQAQFLVNRITSMQLMSSDTQQPFQQIIMQFPLFLSGFNGDLTVQWEGKEQKNGQIDDDHCRILFYLDLETLKETVVDVQIQNRVISLVIYNEQEKPDELIDLWQPLLKENLSHMDYQLSSVKWIKSEPKKEGTSSTSHYPLPLRDDRGYRGVDVRI